MKKLLIVSLFLASVNLIYAENEQSADIRGISEKIIQNTKPAAQPAQKQAGFWDFYEKQQAKLLK